jgi:glutamyl-tRNA synthetase
MSREVRVRFAPSPTGSLHIGGVRTALYNYLFAKKNNGKFIIRIEDTDQNRFVPGAEQYIYEALNWCGIKADEGVEMGGPFGPYKQSERKPLYLQYAMKLVEAGHAYYAFDTAEELDMMREKLKAAKVVSQQYNAITRMTMKNSLTLPEDEVKARLESGEPYVIRLKMPKKEEVRLNDLIRGWVMVHSATLDDKVLMKSDGMPTYHLANVVDDYLMQITHVIRGEEWLPSAPTHVLLYKFLGWEDAMPQFAHLPLLLKPDGNGKLSKRDGESMGFPVFPLAWLEEETGKTIAGFREDGYLPEAVVNFLALLGWNPGTDQEVFSMEELIEQFSIERIGKAGTKFDINKAKWFNQQYLVKKSGQELAAFLKTDLQKAGLSANDDIIEKAAILVKERATLVQDLFAESRFLFERPATYDEQVVTTKWNDDARKAVGLLATAFEKQTSLDALEAKELLNSTLEAAEMKPGKMMQAIRLAITGRGGGPDLMEIIGLLGKAEVAARLKNALEVLG